MTTLCSPASEAVFKKALSTPWGDGLLYTRASPKNSEENEDAVASVLTSKALILAVADGVSGQRSAAEASQEMLATLQKKLRSQRPKVRNLILDSIEKANTQIFKKGRGAGTTLALVEITKRYFRPYLVGDSSVFLVGQKGKLRYKSIAHSPVGYALASGLIEEDEALSHEEGHFLMNAVGGQEINIELGPLLKFRSSDTLLICSDGLTDLIPQEVIVETIRKGELPEVLDLLIGLVDQELQKDSQKEDDLSIILFRPADSATASSQPPQ